MLGTMTETAKKTTAASIVTTIGRHHAMPGAPQNWW